MRCAVLRAANEPDSPLVEQKHHQIQLLILILWRYQYLKGHGQFDERNQGRLPDGPGQRE